MNAIQRQQYQTIQKLLRLWCSLQTVINKDGQTALQLAEELARKDQNALRCLKIAIETNLATNVSYGFVHLFRHIENLRQPPRAQVKREGDKIQKDQ